MIHRRCSGGAAVSFGSVWSIINPVLLAHVATRPASSTDNSLDASSSIRTSAGLARSSRRFIQPELQFLPHTVREKSVRTSPCLRRCSTMPLPMCPGSLYRTKSCTQPSVRRPRCLRNHFGRTCSFVSPLEPQKTHRPGARTLPMPRTIAATADSSTDFHRDYCHRCQVPVHVARSVSGFGAVGSRALLGVAPRSEDP
jgi:hypothetical protein